MRLPRLTVAFLGILSLGMVARADDDDDDDRYRYRGGPPPWARRGHGDDDRLRKYFKKLEERRREQAEGYFERREEAAERLYEREREAAKRRYKAEKEYFERLEEAYEEGRGGFYPGVRGGFPGVHGGYPGGGYGRGGYGGPGFAPASAGTAILSRLPMAVRSGATLAPGERPPVRPRKPRPRRSTPVGRRGSSSGFGKYFAFRAHELCILGPATVGRLAGLRPESSRGISRSPPSGHRLAHDDRSQS